MMPGFPRAARCWLFLALLSPAPSHAQTSSTPAAAPTPHDGQHDFDFEIGAWHSQLKRLLHPLTGSTQWVDCDGTSVVRKVWNGRANLAELEIHNGSTNIEGLSLRLYNTDTHLWNLYYATSDDGRIGVPMTGKFTNGRGEFYDQEDFHGRAVYVRFIFHDITADALHFEQSFSDDGGKTWEPNWISTYTRVSDDEDAQSSRATTPPVAPTTGPNDHQHDFDFEFGEWQAHIRRLLHPLSGSNEWVDLYGPSIVRKVWNGRANLGEIDLTSTDKKTHIQGISLRLYNPQARQWNIYWASASDGTLTTPLIGAFQNSSGDLKNARGEFYDREDFRGQPIFVRFIFSELTATTFRLEQSFSPDAAKTWEPNWVSTFTRENK